MDSTRPNPADQLTDALFTSMLALGLLPSDKLDAIALIRQDLAIDRARLGRRAFSNSELEGRHVIALRNAVASAREVMSSL